MGNDINETQKGTSLRESASFQPSRENPSTRLSEFPKKGVSLNFKTRMWANAQPDGRPAEHR